MINGNRRYLLGAANELLVASDLLRRGYAVFLPVNNRSCCDLVVIIDNKPLRVEVKTNHDYYKYQFNDFDLAAKVVDGKITYIGPYTIRDINT
jgi:hypothetical protein